MESLVSHTSPVWWVTPSLLATSLWWERHVSLVVVERQFGGILEPLSSEPKPRSHRLLAVAFCLFALFLQYNYSLVDGAASETRCVHGTVLVVFPAATVSAIQRWVIKRHA